MSTRRKILLLTGATGFIGSHIATAFVSNGWLVVALVRCIPEKPVNGVLYQKYDLLSEIIPALPDELDAFIHAGYIKQGKDNDAFRENSQSALQLLKAIEHKNVPAKLFLSSLSANEQAASVYGRQKADIEKLFLSSDGTVIRAGLVLGNGGLFASMRNYLASKKWVPLFGNGEQPIQYVHIDDLITGIESVVAGTKKGMFVVAADTPVPYRDFYRQLCEAIGVKPKFLRLPYWLAGMMIRIAGMIGMKLPVTQDNLLGLKEMKQIPAAADLKKLGIELRSLEASFRNP